MPNCMYYLLEQSEGRIYSELIIFILNTMSANAFLDIQCNYYYYYHYRASEMMTTIIGAVHVWPRQS